ERGHRLLEDDADVVAAHLPEFAPARLEQVPALEDDLPLGDFGGARQKPHHRQRGHRLARTGLADEGHRFAALDLETDALNGGGQIVTLAETDAEIADREQRGGGHYWNVFLGSNESRTASPTKITSDSMIDITRKPVMPSQGAWRLSLPWASISPSDAEPG